jgi:T-complex protein 11
MANAHMAMLAPFLKQQGVEYEREKFKTRLAAGDISLQHTTAWLQDTVRTAEVSKLVHSITCQCSPQRSLLTLHTAMQQATP